MITAEISPDEHRTASLNHAQLLLQAAINLSGMGQKEKALDLLVGAQQRFETFDQTSDAGIARAWADGLRQRLRKQKLGNPAP